MLRSHAALTRVLITGGGGQLARELAGHPPSDIELHSLARAECDITVLSMVKRAVESIKPHVVINAGAYTAVDLAETNREHAFAVNEGGARNIAEACAIVGATVIQVSTDFVFDGSRSTPYPVDAVPSPINVYGESKLAGEKAVRASASSFVILRCGWLYSPTPGNFLTTMLGYMRDRRPLRVVDDQIGVPTSAADLARVIWWCAAAGERPRNCILHWASAECASRYDFAVAIQELALETGLLKVEDSIIRVKTPQCDSPARRPRYSVLDARETWRAMRWTPAPWRVSLAKTIAGMTSAIEVNAR